MNKSNSNRSNITLITLFKNRACKYSMSEHSWNPPTLLKEGCVWVFKIFPERNGSDFSYKKGISKTGEVGYLQSVDTKLPKVGLGPAK